MFGGEMRIWALKPSGISGYPGQGQCHAFGQSRVIVCKQGSVQNDATNGDGPEACRFIFVTSKLLNEIHRNTN